ncbi:MAG TPA: AsmA family protein, partial [Rhodanobacteraceae bacterium]|nr:AsmA family protein [Rhodanobacteraceae bacterium]
MKKRIKVVLIVFAGVIVLAMTAGWYALHDPDRFIPRITAYLQQQTGLQVRIHHMDIRVFPALVARVYGLEIENPKPFPSGDFLKVPSLDATIEKLPLLGGRIE